MAVTDRNGNAIHLDDGDTTDGVLHVECSGTQRLELAFQNGRLAAVTDLRSVDGATQRVCLMRYYFTVAGDLSRVLNRADECVRSFDYTANRLMRKHVYAVSSKPIELCGQRGGRKSGTTLGQCWANLDLCLLSRLHGGERPGRAHGSVSLRRPQTAGRCYRCTRPSISRRVRPPRQCACADRPRRASFRNLVR